MTDTEYENETNYNDNEHEYGEEYEYEEEYDDEGKFPVIATCTTKLSPVPRCCKSGEAIDPR